MKTVQIVPWGGEIREEDIPEFVRKELPPKDPSVPPSMQPDATLTRALEMLNDWHRQVGKPEYLPHWVADAMKMKLLVGRPHWTFFTYWIFDQWETARQKWNLKNLRGK